MRSLRSTEIPVLNLTAPPLPLNFEDLLGRVRAREEFEAFARRPEDDMDLLEGALLMAREEYPRLDTAAYRVRLREMAEAARRKVPAGAPAPRALAAINELLFEDEGFHGDRETYYDPRNSYINEVIDRRAGIPITLALVYLEVGRRIGLPLEGVNFPGHFLVSYRGPERDVLLDPFEGGRTLGTKECEARLKASLGEGARLGPRFVQPAGARQFLYRMLNNLKGIYMKAGELGRALACVERMLMLVPRSATDRRDRGLLLFHLDFPELARRDLEAYLLEEAASQDAGPVFEHLKSLQQRRRHTS